MPRIYNATFQPFTYDELAAPLMQATQAHQAQEEQFDTLMTDADKMKAFLNEDWQSYKDYSEYVNQLNAAAEDLAKNGLTRQNRGNLLQLKRDYNGKIQAINAGILSRQNAIENFNKSAKGQSSRYIGPRPEDYSVDEYMYGNNPFKLGVDGSEIYSYADEQAKSSSLRRYQEYSSDGYIISEVGVDANATAMVMDALRTGRNFTDPEYALLVRNNPRQFEYMQAVLNDMRDIADTARETFGYGEFGRLNDNGDENWIPTPNQAKFDAEIFGGINKGIQYARQSQADPYKKELYSHNLRMQEKEYDFNNQLQMAFINQGLKDGTLRFNEKGEIVKKNKPIIEEHDNFNLYPKQSVNENAVYIHDKLKLHKENGLYASEPKTINYNGRDITFNSPIDAYYWMHGMNGNDGYINQTQSDRMKKMLFDKYGYTESNFGTIGQLVTYLEKQLDSGKLDESKYQDVQKDLKYALIIANSNDSVKDRSEILKDNDYYLSDKEFKEIMDGLGFGETESPSFDQIIGRIQESNDYSKLALYHKIALSPLGKIVGQEGKKTITDSDILERQKTAAIQSMADLSDVDFYDIDKQQDKITGRLSKDKAQDIIEDAIMSYTTLELTLADNGTNRKNGNNGIVIIFQDKNGKKVGVELSSIMDVDENIYNEIRKRTLDVLPGEDGQNIIQNTKGLFTDDNVRGDVEIGIADILTPLMRQYFGDTSKPNKEQKNS